jgi:hypothetical protein
LSILGKLKQNQNVYADGDGGLVIETKVDLSQIIDINKQKFNTRSEKTNWGEDVLDPRNHIATIPDIIIDELNKKGIMRGYHVLDKDAFRRFLNDPDNRVWRTRGGNV